MNQNIELSSEDREVIVKKRKFLQPIVNLLSNFVKSDAYVHHADKFASHVPTFKPLENQKFQYYVAPSSNSWYPGVSICFDHPAVVEIAVPNDLSYGKLVITVASYHPDSYLLNDKQFNSIDEAVKALTIFLKKNLVLNEKKKNTTLNNEISENRSNVTKVVKDNNMISAEDSLSKKLNLIFDLSDVDANE